MKKMQFNEFGGPEVLHLVDHDKPHAGPGLIRIAVRAAGVNPVDWRRREGQTQGTGVLELPAGLGQDAAGVVDAVGVGVEGVEVGERVFGRGSETYAEFAMLSSWARMPEGLPFDEAAGYPSVVETALRVIREVGVQPSQTLLVSGASGGVGSAVLQIARDRGIQAIGTAAQRNQDYLRSLGATATTYGPGWVERVRELGEVDAALDLAGAGVIRELVELTGDSQKVISIADLGAPNFGVRFAGIGGSMPAALAEAVRLITSGRLHLPIERSYTLADAAQAQIDSQAATHAVGAWSWSELPLTIYRGDAMCRCRRATWARCTRCAGQPARRAGCRAGGADVDNGGCCRHGWQPVLSMPPTTGRTASRRARLETRRTR